MRAAVLQQVFVDRSHRTKDKELPAKENTTVMYMSVFSVCVDDVTKEQKKVRDKRQKANGFPLITKAEERGNVSLKSLTGRKGSLFALFPNHDNPMKSQVWSAPISSYLILLLFPHVTLQPFHLIPLSDYGKTMSRTR